MGIVEARKAAEANQQRIRETDPTNPHGYTLTEIREMEAREANLTNAERAALDAWRKLSHATRGPLSEALAELTKVSAGRTSLYQAAARLNRIPDLHAIAIQEGLQRKAKREKAKREAAEVAPKPRRGRRSKAEESEVLRGESMPIQTGQEFRAYGGALSSGASGLGWENTQEGRTWSRGDLPHFVLIEPQTHLDEWEVGLANFTQSLTASHHLAILWIVARLADAPRWEQARGTVDLLDVAAAIMPNFSNQRSSAREEARRIAWEAIQFGASARVRGSRKTVYERTRPGQRKPDTVPTQIDSVLWAIGGKERPIQPSLFGTSTEIPLRVEVILTEPFARILTHPNLRQFVAMGELLGKIPPGKPAGALARSMGLALFELWRREYTQPGFKNPVSRCELWEKYPPHDGNPDDYLKGRNPSRAFTVWEGALEYLVKAGVIDNDTARELGKEPAGIGWGQKWRNEAIIAPPAMAIRAAIWPRKTLA